MNDEQKETKTSDGQTSALTDGLGKQYGDRNPIKQGIYYLRHVQAMTAEGLYSKANIAQELAHRDIEIDNLKKLLVTAAMPLEVLFCSASHKMHTNETANAIEKAVTEIRNYFSNL